MMTNATTVYVLPSDTANNQSDEWIIHQQTLSYVAFINVRCLPLVAFVPFDISWVCEYLVKYALNQRVCHVTCARDQYGHRLVDDIPAQTII